MTQQFTIKLTKSIIVQIEADSEQEAIDSAINEDDINNGDWERAEHKHKLLHCSGPRDDFDPEVNRFMEDRRVIEMAELYDPY